MSNDLHDFDARRLIKRYDRDRTSQKEETLKEVAKYIEKELKFPSIDGRKLKIPEVLIETFVNSIKICADNVVEYNIRINPNAKVDIPVIPDEEFTPQFHSAKVYIDNTDAVLIKEISVSYEDAKNYANKRKKKVKRVYFDKPVTIRVYANL